MTFSFGTHVPPGGIRPSVALGDQASSVAPDLSLAENFTVTLTGHSILTHSSGTNGQSGRLVAKQDGTGKRRLTIGADVLSPGGVLFLSEAPDSETVLLYGIVGTTMYVHPENDSHPPTSDDDSSYRTAATTMTNAEIYGSLLDGEYLGVPGSIVQSGGDVEQWNDTSGAVRHLLQPDNARKPDYTSIDANFNNRSSVAGDGVDDYLSCVFKDYPGGARPAYVTVMRALDASLAGPSPYASLLTNSSLDKFSGLLFATTNFVENRLVGVDGSESAVSSTAVGTGQKLVEAYVDRLVEIVIDGVSEFISDQANTAIENTGMARGTGGHSLFMFTNSGGTPQGYAGHIAISEHLVLGSSPSQLQRRQKREQIRFLYGIDY